MQDFRNLRVWREAHELTLAVYGATLRFPKEEIYGVTSQMRRSCSSIAANIAEGCGKGGDPEFARYLHIAMGSACELEYHLLLTRDLGLLEGSEHDSLHGRLVRVKQMLSVLLRKLRAVSR